MKKYLAIALLFLSLQLHSQAGTGDALSRDLLGFPPTERIELPTLITEWEPVDTLGLVTTEQREWIESAWIPLHKDLLITIYKPYGPFLFEFEQYRICRLTGIQQRRIRQEGHQYKRAELSDYERTLRDFNKSY